jgi:putative transposase
VIGKCYKRHPSAESLNLLKRIDAAMHTGLQVHLLMDSYTTHQTPKVNAWLARRPHWHVRFTSTSTSWINHVEFWFAERPRKRLQRGVHRSTAELGADIIAFITAHNKKTRNHIAGPNEPTISQPPLKASAKKH